MRQLREFRRIFMSLLRELADQNAYQRHLAAHGRPHSAQEWRRFSEECLNRKFTRPKCC